MDADRRRTGLRVSIHAFRGEGDRRRCGRGCVCDGGFNPRLPGGRRQRSDRRSSRRLTFQSTPSGGKATARLPHRIMSRVFQSTPSGGKATLRRRTIPSLENVSIHAFRGEGDSRARHTQAAPARFNPRLPGGRRHIFVQQGPWRTVFQSTPSGGKATRPLLSKRLHKCVSIHAFRGEGDRNI